jgi:hypothetical protein
LSGTEQKFLDLITLRSPSTGVKGVLFLVVDTGLDNFESELTILSALGLVLIEIAERYRVFFIGSNIGWAILLSSNKLFLEPLRTESVSLFKS